MPKGAKPPTLRAHEEEEILNDVLDKAKKGEPVLRREIVSKVVKFLQSDQRKNPFKNGSPGNKWFSLFRRRHNDKFMELDAKSLRIVEKVGFTDKVLNRIIYPRPPILMKEGAVMMPVKRPPGRPRVHPLPTNSTPKTEPLTPEPTSDSYRTASDESFNTPPSDETCKSQESQGDAPDFQPGSRLEVMDFNEKWYPVKVVEVDYEEGEVLVHFEKWSDRYDEWVRMDSNRIRRPVQSLIPSSKKTFAKGEQVIAVWAYNHKYPATVKEVLPNDKYEVLFCDGYAKVLRGCKLFKATEEDIKNVKMPAPKKPAPPMGADPLDPDLGPKEERRLKKQRLDVLQAYRPHKRQRLEPQTSPNSSPLSRTPAPKLGETPKVVFRMRGRPPKKPREIPVKEQDPEEEEENKWVYEDDDEHEESEQEAVPDTTGTEERPGIRGRRRKRRRPFDESTYFYRGPKQRHGHEEDTDRWNTEVPEGVAPVLIKDHEGYYRESIIIPDRKMPPGWTKHTMRRKSGAKWDVFLVNPDGRKFRSRNELRNYFAELKQPFPEEEFDFMVGRKMEMIKSQVEYRKKLHGVPQNKLSPLYKVSPILRTPEGDGQKSDSDARRIKTLLPKGRPGEGLDDSLTGSNASPALTSPPFPISELRTPDGGFTCCGKNFRKENLFQMHMKHYHPEYSNLFGSTPNVADLAYARTVGEPLEDSRAEAMTPRNTLMERVTKYEAERKAQSDSSTPPVLNGTKEEPEKKAEPVVKPAEKEETVSNEIKKKEEQTSLVQDRDEEGEQVDRSREAQETSTTASNLNNEEHTEENGADHLSSDDSLRLEYSGDEETEDPPQADVKEEPPKQSFDSVPDPPESKPPPQTIQPSVSKTIPVIRPVSKGSTGPSESSPAPSNKSSLPTITKFVHPGQKPPSATTKLTITVTSPAETRGTVKTLLPMRPPTEPKETQEVQKPKEHKTKEEGEEENPVKSKPRKRTTSETLPKKPKLVEPSTGSLEEPSEEGERVPSPSASTSYHRFSRNRTQVPRVSLEKLNITTDSNGRVVLTTPEDKITNTAGRRQFKNYKGANKISKRHKGSSTTVPVEEPPPEPTEPAPAPPSETPGTEIVYENLRKEEIINCICGYTEEDGLMIQCDLCLCWQHGQCNKIDKESDVPEKYVCYICNHPARERLSTHYLHNQDWLKEGKLPTFSFRHHDEEIQSQRESMLKKSHDLTSSLLQLQTVIRSLRIKSHIAKKSDHPKLYLWAKSWKESSSDVKQPEEEKAASKESTSVVGPQPEAAIDETECRFRLLEHVEDYQQQVDDRLTSIQAQIAALESEDPDVASDEGDHYPVTKQTLQMLMRDLDTLGKVAAIN